MSRLSVSRSTMCRAIARIGTTRKKGRSRRRAQRVRQSNLASDGGCGGEPRERLIFVDECGTHTSLAARSTATRPEASGCISVGTQKPGQEHHAAFEHELRGDGPFAYREGATTSRVFETYVEKVLAPSLKEGQVVVMDNLSAHKPKRIKELIEQRGCELVYLPSYSPEYNPIEEAFAKINNLLRKAAARSKEALIEAIAAALSAISAEDIRGYFQHAGCRLAGQLL